jgi:hypothetical protein
VDPHRPTFARRESRLEQVPDRLDVVRAARAAVETTSSTLQYCKVPATATACTAPFSYADADQDVVGGYALLPGVGRVLLVDARGVSPTIRKLLWTSADGGASFGGPTCSPS